MRNYLRAAIVERRSWSASASNARRSTPTRGTSRTRPTTWSTRTTAPDAEMRTRRQDRRSRTTACPSGGGIACTDRSRSTAAASRRTTARQEMLDYFDGYAAATEDPLSARADGHEDDAGQREAPYAPAGRRAAGSRAHGRVRGRRRRRSRLHRPICWPSRCSRALPWARRCSPARATTAAVEHCCKANAGLYYENRDEFVECLQLLASDAALRQTLGENGRRYIDQHYRWDARRDAAGAAAGTVASKAPSGSLSRSRCGSAGPSPAGPTGDDYSRVSSVPAGAGRRGPCRSARRRTIACAARRCRGA